MVFTTYKGTYSVYVYDDYVLKTRPDNLTEGTCAWTLTEFHELIY